MGDSNVLSTFKRILFSLKKEGNPGIGYNIAVP
jgi:hypothetical protein